MKRIIIICLCTLFVGCSSQLQKKSMLVELGMTKKQVVEILGSPESRSFKGESEALQYMEALSGAKCSYMIAWFSKAKLIAITNRRGSNVSGCGTGMREVDWGQMPKPSLDLNIKQK